MLYRVWCANVIADIVLDVGPAPAPPPLQANGIRQSGPYLLSLFFNARVAGLGTMLPHEAFALMSYSEMPADELDFFVDLKPAVFGHMESASLNDG